MWTDADIAGAVNVHPGIAADALAALQLSDDMPRLDPAGMGVAAAYHGGDIGKAWVAVLKAFGVLELFASGLAARGIKLDLSQLEPTALVPAPASDEDDDDDAVEDGGGTDAFIDFSQRVRAFQCRIRKGEPPDAAGSGTLIGPSSVLTAWHVVANPGPTPDDAGVLETMIEVEFLNGLRVKALPQPMSASPCTHSEFAGELPADDAALAGHNDFAVLRLARPVGALLGVAALPPEPPRFRRLAGVYVIHYPGGVNPKVDIGTITKVRGFSLRWGHSVRTKCGSSGGGCFDAKSFRIAGIHQGRDPHARGRLVPASCFLTEVGAVVAQDIAPPKMWSLDGTPEGEFVIGRQSFFEAFAEVRKDGRVRGIWTKRLDPGADLSGLPFTFRILDRLVARDPATRLCRLSFETLVDDFAADVARRVTDSGIAVAAVEPRAGVAAGQSAPEAVGADRGRRIASAINAAADTMGVQLWIFVDHPAIAFGDEIRAALEAFIDQALKEPKLRLVVAGYEAVAMPGVIFNTAIQPPGDGAGMVNDFIGNFAGSDIEVFIRNAGESAKRAPSPERIVELTEEALEGLENVSQSYRPWLAATVGERLRPALRKLFE